MAAGLTVIEDEQVVYIPLDDNLVSVRETSGRIGSGAHLAEKFEAGGFHPILDDIPDINGLADLAGNEVAIVAPH